MNLEIPISAYSSLTVPDAEIRSAGTVLANSIRGTRPRGGRRRKPPKGLALRVLARALRSKLKTREHLLENTRLIHAAEKQSFEFASTLNQFPAAMTHSGHEVSRVLLIAGSYLDAVQSRFSEESCAEFLAGFQTVENLRMSEVWALKPALVLEILNRLLEASEGMWPSLVASLRQIGEADWKELFEAASVVHRILENDPAGCYARMDFDSRELYRDAVGALATHSSHSEQEVALAALELAREWSALSGESRAALRRSHVGYYLLERGLPQLQERVHYRPPARAFLADLALRYPTAFYLVGIELLTFLAVVGILSGRGHLIPVFAAMVLLILPASQTAVEFMNRLVTSLVRPRRLPRLDFSKGVPEDCATMVAVPTLLLNEAQVRDLVLDLEIRFLANSGPNVYFALLTDSPDSNQRVDERDRLVDFCRQHIEALNRRYPGSPFFHFHRYRTYNDSEARWMGWERKRGKLLDLNRLLRGALDAFPTKTGNLSVLERIRYVLTLDSDTQLPRDAAAKLIGTIAHPLNAAVVDPAQRVVVEGYGILQPRIGISIRSASSSRLAALYSGETGFDIYTRAVSDVYQDLFGEGIFTGKGIYEVDAMREVLERRFPENALLSHDLIEGAYARVALVSDVELIDDYPSHFSAYSRRKHRWVRGDWQILRWLLPRVPNFYRDLMPNPIAVISRWKIFDNLRRSLMEPALLTLLLGSWLWLPGSPGYWTAAAVSLLVIPVYTNFVFFLFRAAWGRSSFAGWVRETRALASGHAIAVFALIFLLHQAFLSVDAIVRSLMRVFVTKRKLLEWETAAEAETAVRSKATVDIYLEWTPVVSILLGLLVWRIHPAALRVAAPVLVLWAVARPLSAWLNRSSRTTKCKLAGKDAAWLKANGEKIVRFFQEWSTASTNWIIPDSVHEDGGAVLRFSPTNVGMLLNARIAALHLGAISLSEFITETRQTLDRLVAIPKHRGHLLNWYDVSTLTPLEPRFVSTVDSGNLAASLWTLKQAALAFAAEFRSKRGLTTEMAAELTEIAEICNRLVSQMDFRFLYNSRRKLLSVGYDVAAGRLNNSYYDLLASEARTGVFIAIAKGDIPQEAWFHLGRGFALARGERVLFSWTGTMFEYLMPELWVRHFQGTLMEQSVRSTVKVQREYASRKGVPWGISESACLGDGYAPFGIPELAMKSPDRRPLVISPYASLLALMVDPAAALKNLRQMEEYGWCGRYGLYEAIDYSSDGGEVIRSWMAHHQGMGLLAICNLLFDYPFQRYFHAEPHVLATELLLHERVPTAVAVEREPALPDPVALPAPAEAA